MHRNYYAKNRKYEPVKVISDWGLNFNLGCAVKYIARHGRKGDIDKDIDDLEKAIDYIKFEIEELENIKMLFDTFVDNASQNKQKQVLSSLYGEVHTDTTGRGD